MNCIPRIHLFRPLLICAFLAALTALLAGTAPADEDNYDNIPLLRWTGPGSPGTYTEYMQGRPTGNLVADRLEVGAPVRAGSGLPVVLLLVDSGLQPSIQSRLDTYAADLQAKGYDVQAFTTSAGSPSELKSLIHSHATDLLGCVIVGDVIAAWYEIDNDFGSYGYASFPCDLYYMDLDGTWTDSDSNGIYDVHSNGSGDVAPEIFIGRIDASHLTYGSEASLTNSYFDKLHQYYLGNVAHNDHALTYTEDDWSTFSEFWNGMLKAYDTRDNIKAPDTNRNDYRDNRLASTSYDFIQLACHSASSGHAFTRGGWLSSTNVWNVPPQAMYYNLFCCSASRYSDWDCLGAAYVFNPSQTALTSIGSTKTGSMLSFNDFYKPLGEGKTFGEAFTIWFDAIAPYTSSEISWHYGMTVIGDPLVKPRPDGHVELVVDIKANGLDIPHSIPQNQQARVTVSLQPGDQAGVAHDWWIWGVKGNGPMWWWKYPGSWNKSSTPIRATGAALREVNNYAVYEGTLPVGSYEFFFAIDAKDNIYEGTYIDSVDFVVY